jgi:8-oxo-dGTP pyrophosphatase MutT (NUDIX family)
VETALREAEEEVGLAPGDVEVLAELPAIDTRTTGFRVHPFLARVRPPAQWRLAEGEITGVVTPRVATLADATVRREELFTSPNWPEPRRAVCVELEGGVLLWGLTLRMLDGVVPRLLAGEWPV